MLYPFPSAADLEGLIGRQIVAVVFLSSSIRFWLDGSGYIHIESAIEYIDETGQAHPSGVDRRGAATNLHQLLLHRISAIESEPSCLSVVFENGSRMRIFGNDGPYESGQICVEPWQGEIIF